MRLVYDTETTGLINWQARSLDSCQPRLTQLAAVLLDGWNVVDTLDTDKVGPEFWALVLRADEVVGYNEAFDGRMVRIELLRQGRSDLAEEWENRNVTDVMHRARGGTLGEVYKRWTGKDLVGAHTAMVDVLATIEVLRCIENPPPVKRRTVMIGRRR